jgi:hypothetical protein
VEWIELIHHHLIHYSYLVSTNIRNEVIPPNLRNELMMHHHILDGVIPQTKHPLDDEEAPCVALRNMSIGDVCPKESEEPPQTHDQPSSSMQASPPTQDENQTQNDENEDQEDEPPQEDDNDQGGDEDNEDKVDDQEIQGQRPPHPRVHQTIQ